VKRPAYFAELASATVLLTLVVVAEGSYQQAVVLSVLANSLPQPYSAELQQLQQSVGASWSHAEGLPLVEDQLLSKVSQVASQADHQMGQAFLVAA